MVGHSQRVYRSLELTTDAEIGDIIRQMPECCQAVIDVNGRYKKWQSGLK
jgi:hypothetical protein